VGRDPRHPRASWAPGRIEPLIGTDYYRLDLGEIPFSASAFSRMFRASAEPGQPSKCRSSIRKRFGRRSLPTFLDDLAGLYVLKVVLEHRFAEAQHL
jgi:hypothetical protein